VVARVSAPGEIPRFEKIGVTPMNAATDQVMLLTLQVRNPTLYQLLVRTDDDKEIWEVVVHKAHYLNTPLRELVFPPDLMVLAVRKNGQLIVPNGDTRLESGDQITLLGPVECVEKMRVLSAEG